MDEPIQLGGVIELTGFSSLDRGTMSVLKKIIGNYTRKFIDRAEGFEKVLMHLKKLKSGEEEELGLFELHGKVLIKGKMYNSDLTDRNIFFAVDNVMKKLHKSVFS